MQSIPSIAILLATYNSEKYIVQQIDSILNQTNQDWILYINDDGSTDKTIQIIDRYVEIHNERIIKLLLGIDQLGAAHNFVIMLQEIDAKYYMFCDHDDIWIPTKVEESIKQIQILEEEHSNSAILVHTDLKIVDKNLKIIHESFYKATRINPDYFNTFNYLGVANCVTGCTMLINDFAKQCIPFYPPKLVMHDWWIAANISKTGIISYIPHATILYRQHLSNVLGVQKTGFNYLLHNITKLKKIFLLDFLKYQQIKTIGYGSGYFGEADPCFGDIDPLAENGSKNR